MNSKDYTLKLRHIFNERIQDMLSEPINNWDSLLINAYPPVIHRLSYQIEDEQFIFLQKMFNTHGQKALMHSHSWDFAIKILQGGYEMGMGFSEDRDVIPKAVYVSHVKTGDIYSITDEKVFHYTKPLANETSFSIMLVGPRKRERKALNTRNIPDKMKQSLLNEFKALMSGMRCECFNPTYNTVSPNYCGTCRRLTKLPY